MQQTTVIMILTFYLASCNDDTETWRFTLNSSENNSPTCGKYFIHDVDHFTIKGSLNISEINPYFIFSEIVNPTGGRIHLNCTIKFKNITHPSNNLGYCLCEQENNDTNLYHFTYKFLMKKNYSLSTFQANLTFINASSPDSRTKTIRVQEKIPEVIEIASTDHDIELKVNDDLIDDITNCSKRVNSSNVKIGYSSMEGKRFVKEMIIIYNNKTYMIPNGKEEAIDLNMLDSKEYNVTLELVNCAYFTKQINCMFILEIYRHSENEVHNSMERFPVIAVLLGLLGLLVLLVLGGLLIFIWRKKKKRKQIYKKQDIEQAKTGEEHIPLLYQSSNQAEINSINTNRNETTHADNSSLPHSIGERALGNLSGNSTLPKSINESNLNNLTNESTLPNSADESATPNLTDQSRLPNSKDKSSLLERKKNAIFVHWKITDSRQFKLVNECIVNLYKSLESENVYLILLSVTDGTKKIYDLIGTNDFPVKLVYVTEQDINHLRNMLKETNSQSLQSLRSVDEDVYTDICEKFGQNVFCIDMFMNDEEDFKKISTLLSNFFKKDDTKTTKAIENIDHGKCLNQLDLHEMKNYAIRKKEENKDVPNKEKPESVVDTLQLVPDIIKPHPLTISNTDLSTKPLKGRVEKLNDDVKKYEITEKIESNDFQDALPSFDKKMIAVSTLNGWDKIEQYMNIINLLLSTKNEVIQNNCQQLLPIIVNIFHKSILTSSNPENFKERVVSELLSLLSDDNKNRVKELLQDDINATYIFYIEMLLTAQKEDVQFSKIVLKIIVTVYHNQIKNDPNAINMMREVSSEIDKTLVWFLT